MEGLGGGNLLSIGKALLFIPTYNERENVEPMHQQIRDLALDLDLLFIDDSSPDGTGEVLDRIAGNDSQVRVIHRSGKQGIGSAHLEAIRYAYTNAYDLVLTMDSDFTHQPDRIPELLQVTDADLVIGSRFTGKDGVAEWSLMRKFLTHTGHFLTRRVLKVSHDATGAFRLYRLDRIPRSAFDQVSSSGYAFFFESLFFLCRTGITVKEVPITLPRRAYGHSKMTLWDMMKSLEKLLTLYVRHARSPFTSRHVRSPEVVVDRRATDE